MNYFRILCFFILVNVSLSKIPYKYVPKMIVFDLDFTLWPFWVNVDVLPPFHKDKFGNVMDINGKEIKHYPESTTVLKYLQENNIIVAIYSKSYDLDGSKQLIDLYGWKKYISYVHLFPDCDKYSFINQTNIEALASEAQVELKDILFIDDLHRDVLDFESLEIIAYFAHQGINMKDLMNGIKKFSHYTEKELFRKLT